MRGVGGREGGVVMDMHVLWLLVTAVADAGNPIGDRESPLLCFLSCGCVYAAARPLAGGFSYTQQTRGIVLFPAAPV